MGFVKNESFDGESLDRTTKLLAGISGRVGKAVAERHAPGDFASPQAKQQADTQMIPPLTSLGK